MKQYIELGQRIWNEGRWINIGGTDRLTLFGENLRFDLTDGFPIITTKKIWWRGVVEELLWFLNGSTDVRELQNVGVHIWDANAKPDSTIGDSYGKQWRNWNNEDYDQIVRCIEMLEKRPKTTRNVVMAWNPTQVDKTALPPCHHSFQALSDGKNLILDVTMRSADYCVGIPWNISSYALLAHLLAVRSGLRAEVLNIHFSHIHIYAQHVDGLSKQLMREPLPLPTLQIEGELTPDLKGMKSAQFKLQDYVSHPKIDYEMVVT